MGFQVTRMVSRWTLVLRLLQVLISPISLTITSRPANLHRLRTHAGINNAAVLLEVAETDRYLDRIRARFLYLNYEAIRVQWYVLTQSVAMR